MSPRSLRPASSADGAAVRAVVFQVLAEFGFEPEPEGQDADLADIDRHYNWEDSLFLVLVEPGGRVVGTGGIHRKAEGLAEIRKMYLLPSARGQGEGRRMLDVLVGFARAARYRAIVLESASHLEQALALYVRYGFRPVEPGTFGYRCDRAFRLDLAPATQAG